MKELFNAIYWYCTDFCINMANLLGISYVEFNFLLFLVALPALIFVLLFMNAYRYLIKPIFSRNS